jgi:ATP-dependent DNA helicase RecG
MRDGWIVEAIPVAAERLLDSIMADNALETFRQGLFHFEYRTFPEIALREACMNALCHRDFLQSGPVVVKQSQAKLEISSPGGLVGGVSTTNILCHPPTARNPHLVDLLVRLRLVNRTNLGVRRMFEAMLVEGKEPPLIEAEPSLVRVTFLAHSFSPGFRSWVEAEAAAGRLLRCACAKGRSCPPANC